MRRVLRPGGRLLLLERVRSDEPGLARKQDRMNGLNRFVVGGDCNRPTFRDDQGSRVRGDRVEQTTMQKVPKFVRPPIVGTAVAPS